MTPITSRSVEDVTFEVGGLALSGKFWRSSKTSTLKLPILAIHGWLDNCASFDVLASALDADILCLDLAGHGHSDWRQHLGAYNIWLDLPELLAVADQLGWQEFNLIGHSRGAAIGFLLAATFPKRIRSFVGLDGVFPLIGTDDKAPEQLFHSINTVKKQLSRRRNYYPNFEAAVAARVSGMFPITEYDARLLASRGVVLEDGGYYWRYDPKLSAPSELRLTIKQVEAFASAVECPVLLALASDGLISPESDSYRLLAQYNNWRVASFSGGHHFHMSAQGEDLSAVIQHFLENI